MPGTISVTASGNQDIDGLLYTQKWAVSSLSFSFPTSASFYSAGSAPNGETTDNFGALNTTQQNYVRSALQQYSAVIPVTFTEVTETASNHADLRFALSDAPSTAWAYFPTSASYGGDSWYNKSSGNYDNPVRGNYAAHTFLHEFGHAMGLEHGHDPSNAWGALPAQHDSLEYSVMTYRTYVGGPTNGYTYGTWSAPQTLMQDDIAALQYLYGANFNTQQGNTVYTWSPMTGQSFVNGVGQATPGGNKIFMTLWDGGGNDTYDFSNYATNLTINLQPGAWTTMSSTQLANLDLGHNAAGNIANALLYNNDTRSLIENAIGGSGNDSLTGNAAANNLNGGAGSDSLFGLAGSDTLDGGASADAMFGGLGDDIYLIDNVSDQVTENANEGFDTVRSSINFQIVNYVEVLELQGSANLIGWGNGSENILVGNSGDNKLYGDTGGDTLYGLGGNDILDGGAGADILDGGSGADTMVGGLGDDLYWVDNAGDRVFESFGEGFDTVRSTVNFQVLDYAESLELQGSGDLIGWGASIDNVLVGNSGANRLYGDVGNDTLIGGGGNDYLDGGAGNDSLDGGEGNDTLDGGDGDNILIGGAGDDRFFGGNNYDILYASGGNDRLDGGGGVDFMDGGSGDDLYFVDNVGDQLREFADQGFDTVQSTVSFQIMNYVDALELQGSSDLIGWGGGIDNVLTGNSGNNRLYGDDGNDTLYGLGGNDILDAGAGSDILDGGSGVDIMVGGADDDIYVVDNVDDRAVESSNEGFDTVRSSVNFQILDGVEALELQGSANLIGWGAGIDNVLTGNSGDNGLYGDAGNDTLNGGNGNDYLDGGDGNDTLSGGIGNDTLHAGAGADTLTGGAGNDQLTGWTGNDVFIFNGVFGADVITDFTAGSSIGDIIQLDDAQFANYAAVLSATNDDGFGNTMISHADGSITLIAVLRAQLNANDFQFV
jgi:serralysin